MRLDIMPLHVMQPLYYFIIILRREKVRNNFKKVKEGPDISLVSIMDSLLNVKYNPKEALFSVLFPTATHSTCKYIIYTPNITAMK